MPEVGVWACYGKSVPRQGVIDRNGSSDANLRRLCHGLRTERRRCLPLVQRSTQRNTGKTPGVAALFSCTGSGEPDSSYV